MNLFFVLGLSFLNNRGLLLKPRQSHGGSVLLQLLQKSISLRCLYNSSHHIPADTADGKVYFLQKLLFIVELQVENQVKDDNAASI